MNAPAIGRPANLAARLCAQASSGQILADDRLRERLGALARFEPAGEVTLKGFDAPLRVYDVVGAPDPAATRSARPSRA